MKAIWKDKVIAQSDSTVVVENNHYFPMSSLNMEYLVASDTTTTCGWKGEANYFSIVIDNETNVDAVWYYANPKQDAIEIKDRVAFWRGVQITD